MPTNMIGDLAMTSKPYDLFVSYAHEDRVLVEGLADQLKHRATRLWFDKWEMKPGDSLRERISEGIAAASYFLVILSPASLTSNWVRYELNSGMISEIESDHVRVIPAIAGAIEFDELPLDLRAKFCLDLRTTASLKSSVHAIIDLVQPERKARKELLAELRSPQGHDIYTIAKLREYANGYGDQTVQVAALAGLESLPGPAATLAIGERALDHWGMRGIERALAALARRAQDGGLLVLTSSLFVDPRYFYDKLRQVALCARHVDTVQMSEEIEGLSDLRGSSYEIRDYAKSVIATLSNAGGDLWAGAILSRSIARLPSWAGDVQRPSPHTLEVARTYTENRLPGFVELLITRRPFDQ